MRSMESTGLVVDKFCMSLSCEDTTCDKLKLPTNFCLKYSDLLHDRMELKFRNRYILPVRINSEKCEMKGLLWFFKNMELKGGELLVFEYFGRIKFNVYIIGRNGSEIQYPHIVHCLQDCAPSIVNLDDDGWRFVSNRIDGDGIFDEIDPPGAFIQRCASALQKRIVYVLRNGKKFTGSYDSETCRLSGLNSMFQILGSDSMVRVRSFLFTFDGKKTISISAFDEHNNEIVFPGTPLCRDASGSYPVLGNYFRITVERKHMLGDCFAVEISSEFKTLFDDWENFQCINVYMGDVCWRLLIRKRDDFHSATIEDGWQKMRDDLSLIVGNFCIFECPTCSYDQFRLRVRDGDEEI